ncbi:hypothetical protein Cgig2_019206 [Carnegiea gigantea]|uniref:Uncharacterized protein n=1 Tax=Carnegiea gigantea TaxID=171969 RepID=A0A9Q1GRZ0_9CARY|nr:hypothetical protein Cgig2_019206 [Carnegiea gigantea]
MAVIDKQKLWLYDYVSDCCKGGSQSTIYMNSIHPMEMHDSATVDNDTGVVIGGEALDDEYNRGILLPLNPRQQGRPRKSSGSAQNAERLDTTETRLGIRIKISMHMRQLLPCPWRICLKETTSRTHNMKAYDIDWTLALAFIPQLRTEVTSVVNTVHYGGWTDDMYLFTLPPSRQAAKLNIRLVTLNELNSVVYEVSNASTAHHRGFTSTVPLVTCKEDEIACDYFCLIDPDFRERVKEVIDDLLRESALERDWFLNDHSA